MSRLVYVSGLNPKTTEQDLERFCTRFGNVIECVICPEDDKLSKRSGYVRFASSHSAEKMYRVSCEEPFSIDQTIVDVEIGCAKPRPAAESRKRPIPETLPKKSEQPPPIYTVLVEGVIASEEEFMDYLGSRPLNIKFIESTNKNGELVKTGAQITYNDKELADRILNRNHEKYTAKLITNKVFSKRHHVSDPSVFVKRSKSSHNLYSAITSHLESLTKLTRDLDEENEHLQNDRNVLKQTVQEQSSKLKQIESERSDLMESSNKTQQVAKFITDKYKVREEEHRRGLDESNKMVIDMETVLLNANENLLKAHNEIQRLSNQVIRLETELQRTTDQYAQLKCQYADEDAAIEHFFAVVHTHLQ